MISAGPRLIRKVVTQADCDVHTLASQGPDVLEESRWTAAIQKLREWLASPSTVDEDDLLSPSTEAIETAADLIAKLQESGQPSPQRVVSDGEGGIVFERSGERDAETIRISADGSAEYLRFQNSKLAIRIAL